MMILKKIEFLGVLLMLLHWMVPRILAGRHGVDVVSLPGSNLDEQTVVRMWHDCGLDLVAIREEVQKLGAHLSRDIFLDCTEIGTRAELLTKGTIQEALNLLSLKANRSFLDCLLKQSSPLPNSQEENLRICLADYLDSLLNQLHTRRRLLNAEYFDDTPPSSAPDHPPDSDFTMPIDPIIESASPKKSPSPPKKKPILQKSHDLPPNKGPSVKDAIFIAVAMTAVLTATFVSLLLFCFFTCNRKNRYSSYRRKDDKPLLSLSLSDFSGSSQKSFGNANGLLAPPKPLKTDPSQNVEVSSGDGLVEIQASDVLQGNSSPSDAQSNIITKITDDTCLPESPPPPPSPPPPTETPPPPPEMPPPPPETSPPLNKPPPSPSHPPEMSPPLNKPSPSPSHPPETSPPLNKPSPSLSPPPPPPPKVGPHPSGPPPPPKGAAPPRPPQAKQHFVRLYKPPPPVPRQPGEAIDVEDDLNAPKIKLKPFFWDKVQANPSKSMVWDRLKAGSFQFNEEMIENLFGYNDKNKEGKKALSGKEAGPQYVRILDPKKSQNLSISLKALNVKSEEVREALMEGNELPPELLHTLLKVAPTTDEELKIRLYAEPSELGPAEQFIRSIVDVPFAFQRIEALLFMITLQEESSSISEAFSTLEIACEELKGSRLFLKLLEAVLKTGNRMNDGTYRGCAQAFKLDTLLKLSDVRGADGKTTLLHFVVLEIIRTEGIRASRTARECRSSVSSLNSDDLFDDPPLESGDYYHNLGFKVVSGLSGELQHVKKAAGLDADTLSNSLSSLSERLAKTKDFLKNKMEGIDEESEFLQSLRGFVEHAEAEISSLLDEEKRIRLLVKNATDYFHGNSGKDEGLRMFVIVRDFLGMIDKVCKEVKILPKPASKTQRSAETTPAMSPARDPRQLLFPAIKDRRVDYSDSSSSDDDD